MVSKNMGQGLVVYIAGPMRGHQYFNFPAFDRANEDLLAEGYSVISPADLDREHGFDPMSLPEDYDWLDLQKIDFSLHDAIDRDVAALKGSDAIYLLDGWEQSRGALAEKSLAEWLGLMVMYETEKPSPEDTEDILEEALRITRGDRQASYGPPDQDFRRTAKMWSALKGVEFEPREVALFMIALKLSRETHQSKMDNWVDVAGYARCGSLCCG